MKYLIIYLTLGLALYGCSPLSHQSPPIPKAQSPNIVNPDENGQEYGLTIIDPGFNSWFVTNSKPVGFYSLSYYENWNQIYVQAWNEKVTQQIYYKSADYPFENNIDYDYTVDYGLDLNYKLYYYFRYVESIFGDRYNFPG